MAPLAWDMLSSRAWLAWDWVIPLTSTPPTLTWFKMASELPTQAHSPA